MKGKILKLSEFLPVREKLRQDKNIVVFTNGCFDLIHRGHIEYLQKAKKLGDILVVGLNTDSSIRRIKGEKRPILKESDRALILASLFFVDYVIFFDEDTPENLIKQIKPDILAKGADWTETNIVGADFVRSYGGKVVRIELTEGYSTTRIIERIIELYCKGGER
ncbi:MAG: D-glycero-beta-D-manno-heptose 1-phosphate adenylyltransferase [bacterium]